MTVVCLCGAPAAQLHHAVYQQHVRKHGGNLDDARNLVPVCLDCHRRHHNRVRPISAALLPAAVREFAAELLGDAAPDYLSRYYD